MADAGEAPGAKAGEGINSLIGLSQLPERRSRLGLTALKSGSLISGVAAVARKKI